MLIRRKLRIDRDANYLKNTSRTQSPRIFHAGSCIPINPKLSQQRKTAGAGCIKTLLKLTAVSVKLRWLDIVITKTLLKNRELKTG